MLHDTFHQPLAQTAPTERFEHEYVSNIGVGGVVGNDARKSDLLALRIQSEAQRVLNGTGDNLAWDTLGPVALGQETMDNIQVESLTIGADGECTFAELSLLRGLTGLRRHTPSVILNKHLAISLQGP